MKTNRHYPTNRKPAGAKKSNSSRPEKLSSNQLNTLAKWGVLSYKWPHCDPCVLQVDFPALPGPNNTACFNCEDIVDACCNGLDCFKIILDAVKPEKFRVRIQDDSCQLVVKDVVCVALTLTK